MNIGGKAVKIVERFEDVEVGKDGEGKPVIIRLYAPSLSQVERANEEFPLIFPPLGKGFVRDDKGGLMRDVHKRPVPVRNPEDPGYLKTVREQSVLQSVALIVICARDVVWGAKREEHANPLDYYRAIRAEMVAAGITSAAVASLNIATERLSTSMTPMPTVEEAEKERKALGAPDEMSPKG